MNVLVTGGKGFIGKNFINYISKKKNITILNLPREIDLSKSNLVDNFFKNVKNLNYIFHFAEVSGNKEWSKKHSFQQTLENLKINLNVISAWTKYQKKAKFIFVSSVWSYPLGKPFLKEKEYWSGMLNPETRHFGYNKKIATVLIETAKANFKLKATTLILGTVYGPGDLSDHFIPTIIRRMRKERKVLIVYGTGNESRDFIYIDDQVKGIFSHRDCNEEIINIGTGKLTSIKKIIQISKKLMKFKQKIRFIRPNKILDANRGMSIKKAKSLTGWSMKNKFINLEKGLKNTIDDMYENK